MEKKEEEAAAACKFVEITEGKATLKVPDEEGVFYNPVQEFNRDMTIVVINTFFQLYEEELIKLRKRTINKLNRSNIQEQTNSWSAQTTKFFQNLHPPLSITTQQSTIAKIENRPMGEFVILESLAATGLRSFRYALEVDQAKYIIANDLLDTAVKTIAYNSQLNGLTDKIISTQMDASHLMSQLAVPISDRVEVIDLDPYGSVATFVDSAINAIADGGLLCVTSTDVATLCGNNVDACFYKYGSFSTKGPFCHEMALRIVLNCIESSASRYQRYVVPLMCVSVDFYVRLYVRVKTSAEEAKKSPLKRSNILHCDNCFSFKLRPLGCLSKKNLVKPNALPSEKDLKCENCDCTMKMAGPIYSDPIYHPEFVNECINYNRNNFDKFKTSSRIHGMLTTLSEELTDSPFYYSIPDCFSFVRSCVAPTAEIVCDLIRSGKQVSRTHAKRNSIKTNATSEEFWDSIRAWAKTKSTNTSGSNIKNPNAKVLFDKPTKYSHNFDVDNNLIPKVQKNILRYQLNPTPFWGPLSKNKVGVLGQDSNSKKRKIDE